MTKKQDSENSKVSLEMLEECHRLNFGSHNKSTANFSLKCLNILAIWINELEYPIRWNKLDNRKKVGILFVAKAYRLLRASQILISSGYLPESDILLRSLLEMQAMIFYILGDKSGKRAQKWIHSDHKQRWDSSLILENLSIDVSGAYSNFCSVAHPHILGFQKFIKFKKDSFVINTGPTTDYNLAEEKLALASLSAVGINEIANSAIIPSKDWEKEHKDILNHAVYKRYFDRGIKNFAKIDDGSVVKFLFKLKNLDTQ